MTHRLRAAKGLPGDLAANLAAYGELRAAAP
jgi:hypothetical protein